MSDLHYRELEIVLPLGILLGQSIEDDDGKMSIKWLQLKQVQLLHVYVMPSTIILKLMILQQLNATMRSRL